MKDIVYYETPFGLLGHIDNTQFIKNKLAEIFDYRTKVLSKMISIMRIWSIHPKYLDTKGLVALWRETLLAKNVLEEKTKGYKYHPQLIRFKSSAIHSRVLINI